MARCKRAIARHNRAQQAHQRAAPSRAVSEIAGGTIERTKRPSARHHRAQQAPQRAAPSPAAIAIARGTMARSKRAIVRHNRAQQAHQRAAPSRLVTRLLAAPLRAPSAPARGTIARRQRDRAARLQRSCARLRTLAREVAHSRAARQPTLARQGCPRSRGKAAHARAARLRTLAREAAHPRAARQPTLAREAAHFRVRHASPTREEGSANSCEGCSPASRARSARSRGRIRARARHAPGTRAANCLSSRGMQRAAASKANCRRSSEARQRALATKARSRRSSEARQRALATKARSPRSSEARLARGMQPPLARQAAQAREASCPRSRGRQRALASRPGTIARLARHPRGPRTAPSREAGRALPGWGGWLPSAREVYVRLLTVGGDGSLFRGPDLVLWPIYRTRRGTHFSARKGQNSRFRGGVGFSHRRKRKPNFSFVPAT